MAAPSPSKSKEASPPSIANFVSHKKWTTALLKELPQLDSDLKEAIGQEDLSDLPLKLQSHVNAYSLKRSMEELELQDELEQLPQSGMAGSPEEVNLLCLLLEMMDAKKVVEVGVFRGSSTLAFARCLAGLNKKSFCKRKVIGLDVSELFAQVGMAKWKQAGVDDLIDFRVGDAKDILRTMLEAGQADADMCFIDADKGSYDDYYEMCLKLTKSGGLIVVDNTLWMGRVAIPDNVLEVLASKPTEGDGPEANEARMAQDTLSIKRLTKKIYADDRIERVSFLTIADGVTICRKK